MLVLCTNARQLRAPTDAHPTCAGMNNWRCLYESRASALAQELPVALAVTVGAFARPSALFLLLCRALACVLRARQRSQEGTYEVRERWHQPGSQAKRDRLRRMPGFGIVVVAPSQMRRMRSHRLL